MLPWYHNIHGKENFVFEILKECREEDLLSWEQHYLDLYKDKFNQCEFAGHTLNRIFSEETKRKIGEAFRGENSHFWKGGISYNPYSIDWGITISLE